MPKFHTIVTLPELLLALRVTSGVRRDIDEIFALLLYYAASNCNPLLTFRDNVSVPSSKVKKGPTRRPETYGKGIPFDAA
jgi:hypothetical protein